MSILGTGQNSSMKKRVISVEILIVIFISIASFATAAHAPNGAELYKKHCSACHPDATRLPDERIVEIMRNPPSPMPTFDNGKVSDRDADAISAYIRLQHAVKFF
jgi:mono/diheme cytochrome c family protein